MNFPAHTWLYVHPLLAFSHQRVPSRNHALSAHTEEDLRSTEETFADLLTVLITVILSEKVTGNFIHTNDICSDW